MQYNLLFFTFSVLVRSGYHSASLDGTNSIGVRVDSNIKVKLCEGCTPSHGLYYLERCYVNAFAQSSAQHPVIGAGQFFVNQKKVGVVLGLGMPGKQNPLPMNSAKEWVKILPNARLLRIPRFGHLPFVEQPDIFYPAVEQFLNGEWQR